MSSEQMSSVDVYLDEETLERLERKLEYGDTKSGYAREAIRMRLSGEFDERVDDTTEK